MKKLLPKHIGFEFEIGSSVSRRTVINKFNNYTVLKAKSNSDKRETPIGIIKMNKQQPLAIIDAEYLLKMIGKI